MKIKITKKPWQLIHGLSGYADVDARRIYRETCLRHAVALAGMNLFGVIAGVVIAGVTLVFLFAISSVIVGRIQTLHPVFGHTSWLAPVVLAPVVLAGLSGMKVYAWLTRSLVCACIEHELKPRRADVSRCESCGYSLEGLPEIDSTLRCPECAHETSTVWYSILDDLGIERVGGTS